MERKILVLAALSVLCARAADLEFVTAELPWAAATRGYAPAPLETRAAGKCPAGGVGYAVVSGALPNGLKLSNSGQFSGIPTRTGTYHFTIRAFNGCTWTAHLFSLVVADVPTLAIAPPEVNLTWRAGATTPPAGVLHVSSTWPGLRYQIHVTGDWLTVQQDHGFMVDRDAAVPSDTIALHVVPGERKPGQYEATVEISAWQAEPIRASVKLTVE